MKEPLALRGIVTVLNTPFDAADRVDAGALWANVEAAVDAGVAGFLVPAMASEVGRLDPGERDLLVRTALDAARGRVPVIGGASAPDPADRMRLARQMADAGCAGVLVSIPYEDDAGYRRAVEQVAGASAAFLMLQDWDASGPGVPVALLARLFDDVETLRAVKIEVPFAGRKYTEVLDATGGRMHVSGGWAVMQMIEALDRGVHAFMPTGLHRAYTRIAALYAAGDREGARRLFERVLPVLAFSNQHLDVSIRFFKRLLHAQGVYPTDRVREPLLPFDAHHERICAEMVERAVRLEAELADGAPRTPAG